MAAIPSKSIRVPLMMSLIKRTNIRLGLILRSSVFLRRFSWTVFITLYSCIYNHADDYLCTLRYNCFLNNVNTFPSFPDSRHNVLEFARIKLYFLLTFTIMETR